MKEILQNILKSALNKTINSGEISIPKIPSFAVEKPREEKFGDFYTNIAMVVAPQASKKPRDVANLIINNLNGYSNVILKVEIAGPGFINFFMTQDFWLEALREVIKKGDYINDIAKDIILKKGKHFLELPEKDALPFFTEFTANVILEGIKKDLEDFGVRFDHWYSEKTLHERGMVDKVIGWLRDKDFIYEKDDALWLKASAFGDEKDRVVRRGTGYYTYLASDIAYHKEKYERGFKKVINIWGADHHGYVPRMRSAIKALGFDDKSFSVLLVQLVNLKKGGQILSMSTRSGEFTELSQG